MGNTECQDCISAEREMFAEIILGREFASKKYLSNTKINVKKISDEIPYEHIDNNKDKILIAKNQNQLLQKANQVINKKDGINKESDTNISNKSTKNKEEHNKQSIENDNIEKKYEKNESDYEQEEDSENDEPLDADVEAQFNKEKKQKKYKHNNEDNQKHKQFNSYEENDEEEYEIDDYKNPRRSGLNEDEYN